MTRISLCKPFPTPLFYATMFAMPHPTRRVGRFVALTLLLFTISYVALHCSPVAAQDDPLPGPTRLPSPSESSTSTSTPPPTVTVTPTPTASWTLTSTPTPTPTAAWTLTSTPAPSPTSTSTLAPASTPLPTSAVVTSGEQAARVPILMYHHIATPPPGADAVRVDLSVPPDVFDAEMKFLADQGFHTIHLTDLLNYFQSGAPLPPKPIIITFDDGYDDNYINAFPTLKDHGFDGTFFIISQRADDAAPGYMTWQQIEEMSANGMEIGSHSFDHRFNLGEIPYTIQWVEIKRSHDAIAQHLPNQAPVFAYPSGSYNATTLAILKQLGYVASVTIRQSVTQYGGAPLELRRVRIRGEWSVNEFVFWLSYWRGEM
jgi:peptidoglycan/xylan/chitin deacetylase (PgdA/CDA1 family)